MLVGVLKTDGGPHPPEVWAQVTASQIIDIASSAPQALVRDAREFESKLLAILTKQHSHCQHSERDILNEKGPDHLISTIDTDDDCECALDDIIKLAHGTSFAGHFAKPEVKAYLERVLHEHFHHAKIVERSWAADSVPDHPSAQAFKAKLNDSMGAFAGPPPSERKAALK